MSIGFISACLPVTNARTARLKAIESLLQATMRAQTVMKDNKLAHKKVERLSSFLEVISIVPWEARIAIHAGILTVRSPFLLVEI